MRTLTARLEKLGPALAGGLVLAALTAGVYAPSLGGWAAQGPDWSLLADESVALKVHLAAAIGTLLAGVLLLAGVKGRSWHKRLGWSWVALMAATAISSFWLQRLQPGSFSWIHGLSGWVLVVLPAAVYAARRRRVAVHRRMMMGLFIGGPVIAGGFALLPGRLIWRVVFGS